MSDDARFREFYANNFASVVKSLSVATGDRRLAEDVAQEAFAKAFVRWRSVSRMERPVGWVYVSALRAGRRRARREPRTKLAEVGAATVTDHAHDVAIRVSVRQALAQMPPRQRTALVLRYVADLSINDIAEAMGCRPGTVKATLHAAQLSLQARVNVETFGKGR